jgi:hypothetical protein
MTVSKTPIQQSLPWFTNMRGTAARLGRIAFAIIGNSYNFNLGVVGSSPTGLTRIGY